MTDDRPKLTIHTVPAEFDPKGRDPRTNLFTGRIVSEKREGGKISYQIESHPFQDDPPYALDFYDALGRLVVLWGRFEHHLESNLRVLIAVAKTFGIEQEMYVSFSRKTKTFRGLYRDCAPLSPEYKAADALMTRAEDISEQRNRLIHSIVNGWGDGDPPYIKLRCYYHEKKQLRGLDIEATISDIKDVYNAADKLNTNMMALTNNLHRIVREKL
jgi:hypothetical protein